MAISDALGFNYQIPQGQGAFIARPAAPTPITPEDARLPELDPNLAYVQGLTDKYYNTYGKLKGLVEQTNSMGIDITRPDYSDDSKMQLFDAYKQLEGDLLITASKLKQHQKQRGILDPLAARDEYRYTVDPNAQVLTDVPQDQIGFATSDPRTDYVLEIMKESPQTQGDLANQQAMFDKEVEFLNNKIRNAANPTERAKAEFNLDRLTKAYKTTRLFNPSTGSGAANQLNEREGATNFIKQLTFAKSGADGFNESEVKPDGSIIRKNSSYSGWNFAPSYVLPKGAKTRQKVARTVDHFYIQNGKVYAQFQPATILNSRNEPILDANGQPTVVEVQPEEISNKNAAQLAAMLFENNSDKIGMPYNKFLGLITEFIDNTKGTVMEEKITGGVTADTVDDSELKNWVKEVETRLNNKQGVPPIPTPFGDMTITYEDPFWGTTGWRVKIGGDDKGVLKTPKDVLKMMNEVGVHDMMAQQLLKVAPSTMTPPPPTTPNNPFLKP